MLRSVEEREKDSDTKPLYVYLAGPSVFRPNPVEIGKQQKQALEKVGCIGLYPMDPEIPDFQPNPETAYRIGEGNEDLMRKSQVFLIEMTPWHGPFMDDGTAFESGFASCLADLRSDVLIIGYYANANIEHDFRARVVAHLGGKVTTHPNGTMTDLHGNTLENFGLSENLMIPHAIMKSGGRVFWSFQEAVDNIRSLWLAKEEKLSKKSVADAKVAVAQPAQATTPLAAPSAQQQKDFPNKVNITDHAGNIITTFEILSKEDKRNLYDLRGVVGSDVIKKLSFQPVYEIQHAWLVKQLQINQTNHSRLQQFSVLNLFEKSLKVNAELNASPSKTSGISLSA